MLQKLDASTVPVPADVPTQAREIFVNNYLALTKNTNRLMLFAGDQKIEHLHGDFYGQGVHSDAQNPVHLFNIAEQGTIGGFATQLGLIARYGAQYPEVNYIVKLNSKTNLVSTEQKEPISSQLWSIQDVLNFQENSRLNIRAVGYTLYLGSEDEHVMLTQAAQIIQQAHLFGLVTILWIYPRGKSVKDDVDGMIVAGATGLANCLGADFVKVKPPRDNDAMKGPQWLKVATAAAGNTQIICSGGAAKDEEEFLYELHEQLHIGGTAGNATGRNIHRHALPKAVALTKAISALVYEDKKVDDALKIYNT